MFAQLKRFEKFVTQNIYFTISTFITCTGLALFFLVLKQVRTPDELVSLDLKVNSFVHEHRIKALNVIMHGITQFGNLETVILGLVVGSTYFFKTKHWNTLIAFIVSIGGGQLFIVLMKFLIRRDRPSILNAIASENTFSFPSGHSFMSVCLYGFLTYFVVTNHSQSSFQKIALIISTVFLIIMVGLSRIYLGVHWMSDVLGSWAAGGAWISSIITILEIKRRYFKKPIPK